MKKKFKIKTYDKKDGLVYDFKEEADVNFDSIEEDFVVFRMPTELLQNLQETSIFQEAAAMFGELGKKLFIVIDGIEVCEFEEIIDDEEIQ